MLAVVLVLMGVHHYWMGLNPIHPDSNTGRQDAISEEPVADYSRIDAAAIALQPLPGETAAAFAQRLAQPAQTEVERARAIFRWIADNIAYDKELIARNDPKDVAVETAFAKRTTICSGYAQLYEAMAHAVGLECEVIHGWAKNLNATAATGDHAWNSVKVDGRWGLLDTTFAAGSVGPEGFVKEFKPWYFLPNPEHFVQSHLPSHPEWQFVNPPWTLARFDALPQTWSSFFGLGLVLGSHLDRTIVITNGELHFWILAPRDVYLGVEFYEGDAKLSLPPQVEGRAPGSLKYEWVFNISGHRPDRLVVFAGKQRYGYLKSVVEYKIQTNS
jgi:transglutaminase/protease-like cytokinesis protein 3